jgi:xanthine dehydrogenase accessory factor
MLVTVVQAQGSVPRERGAWMGVGPNGQWGTIGGGHLEWDALRQCRERLAQGGGTGGEPWTQRVALGPRLGQCCGGVVTLRFEPVGGWDPAQLGRRLKPLASPVALFGGGHVGRAVVQALTPLPFQVRWVDSRDEVFPTGLPAQVEPEHSDPVHRAVADLLPGSAVLIMSFSHAEDLDIVAACLERQRRTDDLPWVGLIGSKTKWATFRHRLTERGFTADELARVTCPIGLPGLVGKEPAVIAASVVAQLLLEFARSQIAPPEAGSSGL